MVLNSTVDIEDTVVLCCTNERARARLLVKLGDIDHDEMQCFEVDRKGASGSRSSQF